MSNPKISVIVPTYNRRKMLCQCLDSIIMQTYPNKEIIVVDDNSSDDTQQYLTENYSDNIIYIRNERNMGCSYNRRLGFERSNGSFVVFMDDDDYYTDRDFFKKAIDIYQKDSDGCPISFVGANAVVLYENDGRIKDDELNVVGFIKGKDYLADFQIRKNKPHSTFTSVFSREKLEASGLREMNMVNDASIYMRTLLSGDAYLMPDTVGVYRMHGKNISYDLSVEFLMENLNEKKYVSDETVRRGLFDNGEKWLYDQTMMTVQYFINGRGRTRQDIDALCKWCGDNLGSLAKDACKEIKKRYAKRKLRNLIKGR